MSRDDRASTISEADDIVSLGSDNVAHQRFGGRDLLLSQAIDHGLEGEAELDSRRMSSASRRRRSTVEEIIRSTSVFQKLEKISWWDTEFKRDRIKVYSTFLRNYLILCVILCIALSFMWGVYYGREKRYVNLKMILVGEADPVDGIPTIIGDSMNITAHQPQVATISGWEYYTYQEYEAIAAQKGHTVEQELIEQVHHENCWGAFYVKPNATYQLYQAIVNNDTTFTMNNTLVEVFYETGRDVLTVSTYTSRFLEVFELAYFKVVSKQYSRLVSQLPQEAIPNAAYFLSQPIAFLFSDMRPAQLITLAPLQLGLVYIIVFAFFQMSMTIKVLVYLSTIIKGPRFLLAKFLWSQAAYATISLSYTLLNVAFGISYQDAFGHSGALVMWAIAYLTISALGTLNEIIASFCFLYFPPMIGGWLLFLIVVNVAPTTSPMALTNAFYRYGYSMPVHNSFELIKVVFFNTYKGEMGRHFGILIAWVVITNIASPFAMLFISKKRKQMAEKNAADAAEAAAKLAVEKTEPTQV